MVQSAPAGELMTATTATVGQGPGGEEGWPFYIEGVGFLGGAFINLH
jgi:hypothetical protein